MKKRIIALGFAMMFSASAVYADTTVDVCTYDRDTKIASVSGTADCDEVTVSVKNGDEVLYEGQQTAENGKYSFDFQLSGSERVSYTVLVGGTESDAKHGELVYYGNEVDGIFASLNSYAEANNSEAFQALFAESLDVLGLELSADEQSAIPYMATALMAEAPYSKVGDMKKSFDTAKYLYDISVISDAAALDTLIKANDWRITDKYPNVFEVYSGLDDTKRTSVCSEIINAINHKVVTADRFKDIFATKTMSCAIKEASGWSAAKEVISKTKSELQIKASTLTDNSKVYIDMMNSEYSEIADFNSVYSSALKANEVDNSYNSGGSSSGGSSSGGGGGGSYSKGNTSSTFVPKKEEVKKDEVSFNDIGNVAWAKEAIEGLAKAKIISGRDENTFDPDAPILREEFIKMLVLAFDINTSSADTAFDDVTQDKWFAGYVNSAKQAGIVSGISENIFGAGENITRQDMVTITYRAMQKYNLVKAAETGDDDEDENIDKFADDSAISDYARDGIYYLKDNGVVKGRENDAFCPQESISRAEAAKILYAVRNMKIANNYVAEETVE